MATLGVAVSTAVTAAGAHLLLGMDWQLALLLGAIVSSTDAAAVFSVLRVLPLPRRLAGLLEAESGLNDAPAVILVLMFSAVPLAFDPAHGLVDLVYELAVGAAIGLLAGRLPRCRHAAPDRAARVGLVSAGYVRAGHGGLRGVWGHARQWVPRGLPDRSGAREFRSAASRGHPVVRRGAGLAGPRSGCSSCSSLLIRWPAR